MCFIVKLRGKLCLQLHGARFDTWDVVGIRRMSRDSCQLSKLITNDLKVENTK